MTYCISGQISDHIGETEDSFLIATDCVIARTGNQEYQVKDLPQDGADELGVDLSDPNASVNLFRPPEEVFDEAAMASFEGKPLVRNHPANGDFVTPDNIQDLSYGHAQNIRRGSAPLESGDWPLLGDIIITREPVLSQIKNGARPQISLGYSYQLASDDGNLLQTNIRGNHVALVPKGRAGEEVRVVDSAPQQDSASQDSSANSGGDAEGRAGAEARTNDAAQDSAPALAREIPPVRQSTGSGSAGQKTKEHKPMSLKQIFGRGLKAAAQDAETKPEDLADMATEFAALGKKAEDVKADDKTNKAKDAEVEKPPVEKRVETPKAEDRHAMDRRKAMHDALDKMLAREEELGGGHEAEDVDLDELGELVTQFLQEEKGEAEHQDVPPIEAESEEQSVEADGANPLPPDEEAEALAADRRVRAADRFLDGKSQVRTSDAREILDTLRRGIARTGDRDLIRQFNGLASRFTRSSRSSNGAYGSFARSAAAVRTGDVGPDRYKNRNEFAPAGANRTLTAAQQQELQEAYNKRRSTNMEVKQ